MKKMKNYFLYNFQRLNFIISYLFSKGFKEDKLIISELKNNSIIFDIGSNMGSFLKILSKKCKNINLSFHSFDPISSNIEFQQSIKFSVKHRFQFNNIAISNFIGESEVYENSISSQSTIKEEKFNIGKMVNKHKVQTLTVDEYCRMNNIFFIDLLKIDAEGSDLDVLHSAKKLLEKSSINIIKMEIANDGKIFEGTLNFLSQYGYKLIGTVNHTFKNNELILFDCYFKRINNSQDNFQ